MPIEIKNRFSGTVLKTVDAENLGRADLRGGHLRGADLGRADLRGADLRRADLRGADLRGADIGGADLRGADIGGADLRGADLRGAYLGRADLDRADLRGADLDRADLRGAKLNWQSHQLIAELLLHAAEDDIEKRKIAGLVAVSLDWCWKQFLNVPTDLREWALDALAAYVVEGDNAPGVIFERAACSHVSTIEPELWKRTNDDFGG